MRPAHGRPGGAGMREHWQEQVQRYVDGQSSAEEIAALDAALSEDAALRAWFVDLMNLDVALGAAADAAAMTRTLVPFEIPARTSWFSRPLSIAAAAAVILCAGAFWFARGDAA